MDPCHPQVPVLDFECDEEIAELITLINDLRIDTLLSCQDNNGGRGTVRRVWVQIYGEDLLTLLEVLDQPDEADEDVESLSNRIAGEYAPDDWEAFHEDRCWHYQADVDRSDGELQPLEIGIRFPYTDLPEVVTRLRTAARELYDRVLPQASDQDPEQQESSSAP